MVQIESTGTHWQDAQLTDTNLTRQATDAHDDIQIDTPVNATEIENEPDNTILTDVRDQITVDETYRIHVEFETNINEMNVTVLTLDIAATLALIDEDLLDDDSDRQIEPCDDIFLRSAISHRINFAARSSSISQFNALSSGFISE